MEYSFFNRIRDILLLCALIFLAKTAFDRTSSFVAEHKQSLVHELDRTFIEHIYTAQRQLHFLEEHPIHAHTYAHELAEIKEQLATIEEKYKKNSPSMALLGPIGSAAIVVKEAQLEQKLLDVLNELGKIFANINNALETFSPSETITSALDINKQILRTLIA
jgi:hypothetical protein